MIKINAWNRHLGEQLPDFESSNSSADGDLIRKEEGLEQKVQNPLKATVQSEYIQYQNEFLSVEFARASV